MELVWNVIEYPAPTSTITNNILLYTSTSPNSILNYNNTNAENSDRPLHLSEHLRTSEGTVIVAERYI